MTRIDRRKGKDRRGTDRHGVSIEIEWENIRGKHAGTINDISTTGCFLLSGGEVEDGENVKIYFPLTNGETTQFWGRIVNHVFEVGFAVKFVGLTDTQTDFLERFVDAIRID